MKNNKLKRINVKNIYPLGWIKDQLITQKNGLTNNLQKFWPDIAQSGWIGGDRESWERVPYWLDGYIPLAYLLKDEEMINTSKFYVDSIISRQQDDGWIAPKKEERSKYDVWGIFIMLKALNNYAEINNDKKVYEAIYKALKALDKHIDQYPLFDWAKQRWFECLIPLYSIYHIYHESWLIDLASKLHDQGFDFISYYQNDFPTKSVPKGEWRQDTHIVNNAMAVKCYALYYLLTNNKKDYQKVRYMLSKLNKYHGAVTGAINGDECLAGLSANHGSELCSIVELMYSLEILNEISGKNIYQDQLERLAFNALPSSTTPDMWAHQYVNQVNAPFIDRNENNIWTTNGWEANIYGLEPNYGCCTANMHQGWPKFVFSSIYLFQKGIQINSYIPLEIKEDNFNLKINSYYPFKNKINIFINSKKEMNLKLLIPYWASKFLIDNKEMAIPHNHFYILKIHPGNNEYNIEFMTNPIFINRRNNYLSLRYGSLIYALKVEQEKIQVNQDDKMKEYPHADYIYKNLSPFNYGIVSKDINIKYQDVDESKSPFVSEINYQSLYLKVKEIGYKRIGNYILLNKNIINENIIEKEFIPIGINKLHMGELPYIDKK